MRVDRGDDRPLRIALASYRSKPHCGGQGVYVRHLSRELARLGHRVEVFSGPPYPDLDSEAVTLTKVPSLDLYADGRPSRSLGIGTVRDWIDVLELASVRTGGFPEPLTFSLRLAQMMQRRSSGASESGGSDRFDLVHDNQTLGRGLLRLRRAGLPLVTTIHHPISRDRRIEIAAAAGIVARYGKWRWYQFVRMQARVAPQVGRILTVSAAAKADVVADFGVAEPDVHIVPLGVDVGAFHPRADLARVPGRIVAIATSDAPVKGIDVLLRAVAKVAVERDVHLVVVGALRPDGPTARLLGDLALGDRARFVTGLSDLAMGELLAGAEIAVVPSRYEGFCLPAVEFMASGTPLIATTAGALPEVVGEAGVQVAAGDVEALAAALLRLHDDPAERSRLATAGTRRVQQRYTWTAMARATADHYRAVIADHERERSSRPETGDRTGAC